MGAESPCYQLDVSNWKKLQAWGDGDGIYATLDIALWVWHQTPALHAPRMHAESCCRVFKIRRKLRNVLFVSPRSLERVTATLNRQQDCLPARVAAMWMCLNMAQLHGLLLAPLCWFCFCLREQNDPSLDPCLVLFDNTKDCAREEEIWRFNKKVGV